MSKRYASSFLGLNDDFFRLITDFCTGFPQWTQKLIDGVDFWQIEQKFCSKFILFLSENKLNPQKTQNFAPSGLFFLHSEHIKLWDNIKPFI